MILALVVFGEPAGAAENRYDVLGKLLAPFVSVLAKNPKTPNRALSLSAHVERLTKLPPELAGARAELALQAPDRLRLHAPVLGEDLVVCRDGQKVWATPGEKVNALIDAALLQKKLAPVDPSAQIAPFELPVPEKQLVFLPVLFVVKDAGVEAVDGEDCRVLDVSLMPELEKSLRDKGWAARIWVRPDYRPARLVLARPGWELAVKFDNVTFTPKLPETTWQPPAEDVITLSAPRFRQLLQTLVH